MNINFFYLHGSKGWTKENRIKNELDYIAHCTFYHFLLNIKLYMLAVSCGDSLSFVFCLADSIFFSCLNMHYCSIMHTIRLPLNPPGHTYQPTAAQKPEFTLIKSSPTTKKSSSFFFASCSWKIHIRVAERQSTFAY